MNKGRFLEVSPVERESFSQQAKNILQGIADTLAKKNKDYSKQGDAYANFRTGEEWGVDVLKSIRLRMGDKLQRIDSFLSGSEMENESITDSFMDVIGYATLAIVALENVEKDSNGCS